MLSLTTKVVFMIENFKPQGFINQHSLCSKPGEGNFLFCFLDNSLLLKNGDVPRWQDINSLTDNEKLEKYCFGELAQKRCLLINGLAEQARDWPGFEWRNIRACHEALSEPLFRIAGLARQLQY